MNQTKENDTSDKKQKRDKKNIVVLCDGTNNQVNINAKTNILRLVRLLKKDADNDSSKRQIVYYDPGLGTEGAPGVLTLFSKKLTKWLGLLFGYGFSKKLADAYTFIMQHYEPGDRIYIFGFSRGAYTARALTGLLGRIGLLERGCDNLIPYAIKYYQANDSHQLNFFKQRFSRTYSRLWNELIEDMDNDDDESKGVIPVHFLGVWDTVKSIGTFRRQIILPDTDWLPNMINGRHAVSLDENRRNFQCELWQADTDSGHENRKKARLENRQKCLHVDVQTMWFAGVHADVGGGYGLPDEHVIELKELNNEKGANDTDKKELRKKIKFIKKRNNLIKNNEIGLAYISLEWMIEAAITHKLLFDDKVMKENPLTPSPCAKQHDEMHLSNKWRFLRGCQLNYSRSKKQFVQSLIYSAIWSVIYRSMGTKLRTPPLGAQIHPSVKERIQKHKEGHVPARR